jgi:hypothetical protein
MSSRITHLTWLQNGELLYPQSRISSALTADFSPKIVRNFRLIVAEPPRIEDLRLFGFSEILSVEPEEHVFPQLIRVYQTVFFLDPSAN